MPTFDDNSFNSSVDSFDENESGLMAKIKAKIRLQMVKEVAYKGMNHQEFKKLAKIDSSTLNTGVNK